MFPTIKTSIQYFLRELTYEDVEENFSSEIFRRGKEYAENGNVGEVFIRDNKELVAEVQGTDLYEVVLLLQNNVVFVDCDCPYDDDCKHIVAVLIGAIEEYSNNDNENIAIPSINTDQLKKYLQSFSKKDLIDLVLNYAPHEFKEQIMLEGANSDEAKLVFDKANVKIQKLFKDNYLLQSPDEFENALLKQFDKLKPISDKISGELGMLILEVLDKVSDLTEEGYLYNSFDDVGFEGANLSLNIRDYIRKLAFAEKMVYILKLKEVLSDMDYDICSGVLSDWKFLFSEEDLPSLKTFYLDKVEQEDYSDSVQYYKLIEQLFSEEEKAIVLSKVFKTNDFLTLTYAGLLENKKNNEEAIKVLEVYIKKPFGYLNDFEKLYSELIRLKNVTGELEKEIVVKGLKKAPTMKLLELAVEVLPDDKKDFEEIVEHKDVLELIRYLEKQDRIEDAIVVINRSKYLWDDSKFNFFKKHKNKFPNEAKEFFASRIEKELEFTGDHHYYIIADTLKALKSIKPEKAKYLVELIRTKYKRRWKLMDILQGI